MNGILWQQQMDLCVEQATWMAEMASVVASRRLLRRADVIDLKFSDGSQREVYVSVTEDERQRGLSELAALDLDGMLFCYSQDSEVAFTMAKMLMEIDIAWYDGDGKWLGQAKALPASPPLYPPSPFRYVLEAPVGTIPLGDLRLADAGS